MSYKILIVVNPQVGGVEYHRQLIPHYHLYAHYKDEFEVSQINEIESANDDFLKQFQLIQFSRGISFSYKTMDILQKLKRLGIVSVLDIDDYWKLHARHLLYDSYKTHNISNQMLESIRYCDHITTTTSFFAGIIQSINPNVTVLPNAIDPTQPQYEVLPILDEVMRFGWVGGSCHLDDIELLEESLYRLNTDTTLENKYKLFLMGFNADDKTGVYFQYEKFFKNGLSNQEAYSRINGTNVYSYAQGYNLFDVALVPLNYNLFNTCKSELKMIEAGFMKKAVIASNILPYTILAKPSKNCLIVKESRNRSDWYHQMRKLIQNPNMAVDLALQLYEDVKVKYHIDTVNETRAQLYRHLLK